ncbi:MurR/RpiR family transcriptional regulator [Virgibacillus sp. 179-BFC.A HS]|uniref:MurR/RpiR family transcriptional regulator n=1 Tax=Tigheibacillus jepli TaxID=3035914 RepID=A0ABU5CFE9_9BACI|nr:MurR/RpiR family transcriptional regulator [Virgibacillus sp. 179-BFC.A HS]MDY0405052.1 MurR/RpiR family transcriptional regulator [Virgibacillus sp. 179-BFC.A HS]
MEENIILQIKSALHSLSKAERKIGEYILQHAVEIVNYNTSELAQKAGVSSATIVRFCRSIGLSGFSQLKIRLYADASGVDEDLYTDITPNENVAMIAEKLALRFNHSISQTVNQLDQSLMENVSKIIDSSTTIYVYGLGASHIVAEDFTQKFSRIGKTVVNMLDHHLLSSSFIGTDEKSVFWQYPIQVKPMKLLN